MSGASSRSEPHPVPSSGSGALSVDGLWRRPRTRSPFLWIMATPLATLPLGALLILMLGGEHEAEALGLPQADLCRFGGSIAQSCFYYFEVWRIWLLLAVPGALNLLVALWLLNRNGYVRLAAALALVLALARTLVVPLAAIAISQFDVINDGGLYFRVQVTAGGVVGDVDAPSVGTATWQLLLAAWTGGLVMWAATVALWRAYEPLMARFWRTLEPPGGPRPRPEDPQRWTGFLRGR